MGITGIWKPVHEEGDQKLLPRTRIDYDKPMTEAQITELQAFMHCVEQGWHRQTGIYRMPNDWGFMVVRNHEKLGTDYFLVPEILGEPA